MNKKAFTLIEMIAAVLIISLLSVIVVAGFKNVLNKNKENKYAEFKRELEQAACTYIDLSVNKAFKDTCYGSNVCNVTVDRLIKDGLVSEKLINPNTDETVNKNMVIRVSWTVDSSTGAKEKKCTLQ